MWDLQGLRHNRMPSTVSPALSQDILEGSAGFPLKLLLEKLKFELLGWEDKKPSPGVTVLGISASVQGPNVLSPKLAGASQSCPSQSPPGNTNRRGLSYTESLTPDLRLSVKIFPYKQWWKTHLLPIFSRSNSRSGEDYIILTHDHNISLPVCVLAQLCLFVTPWTATHQALLSVGFPRQEYWSGLPFPTPEDLPSPGIEPTSPALAGAFFTTELPGKPLLLPAWNPSSHSNEYHTHKTEAAEPSGAQWTTLFPPPSTLSHEGPEQKLCEGTEQGSLSMASWEEHRITSNLGLCVTIRAIWSKWHNSSMPPFPHL